MFDILLNDIDTKKLKAIDPNTVYSLRMGFQSIVDKINFHNLNTYEKEINSLIQTGVNILTNQEKNFEILYFVLTLNLILYNFVCIDEVLRCLYEFYRKFRINLVVNVDEIYKAKIGNIFALINTRYPQYLREFTPTGKDRKMNLQTLLSMGDIAIMDESIAKIIESSNIAIRYIDLIASEIIKDNIESEFRNITDFFRNTGEKLSKGSRKIDRVIVSTTSRTADNTVLNSNELLATLKFIVTKLEEDAGTRLLSLSLKYVIEHINVNPVSLVENINNNKLIESLVLEVINKQKNEDEQD